MGRLFPCYPPEHFCPHRSGYQSLALAYTAIRELSAIDLRLPEYGWGLCARYYCPVAGNYENHSATIITNRIPPSDHDQPKQSSIARGKPEWQKNTLRVCGNWSEQLSSKGKVYFYNCITEVSQWQKPLEWTLPDMTQSELHKFICDRQGEGQTVKRPYSALNQVDRVKSRLQDGASSPKRQRYSGSKGGVDRTKIEGNSYSHLDQHNLHVNSPRKVDRSGHGSPQRVHQNIRDSFDGVKIGSSLASTSYCINSIENHGPREESGDFQAKVSSNRVLPHDDKIHQNPTTIETGRFSSLSPLADATMPPKLASILAPHSTRSPLLMTASSGQMPSSDPQSSTSRSSSPSLPRNETTHTLRQHPASMCQRRPPHDLPAVNNGDSLLPDIQSKDGCSSKSDRRSTQIDKQPTSPQRTSSIKPDQVLRNLVSVLSHVVDKRDRLSLSNASGCNNRTPPVNSASRSQPLVANLLSTFLGTHRTYHAEPITASDMLEAQPRLTAVRDAVRPHFSLPALSALRPTVAVLNRVSLIDQISQSPDTIAYYIGSLNGSDKTKNERTPTCPSSSDGTSIISPCPRNSPSPANTASDFRNHPQKRHSPLDSRAVVGDALQLRRSHSSEEDGGTVNPLSACASDSRRYPLSLDAPEVLQFVDSHLSVRFQHPVADTIETEAQSLLRNFDRLHSVLYSELSGELKKLRALVCISETKLKIHQQRKESLQELMDAIESKKALPLLGSPDAPI
ncbi:WW domain-containing adapter protein with coiled-coil [Echinococcus granulosus]|uniref:WW domain-containing adapter protein with coiled-coil n=1 Tax=Echinococcus granulosus TaxID=6210 RepID=W6ULR5_ECHGR|nr:WW domain-containing adapter protein with coiled-coil [Echinococcus granulosus]EUB62470.1 WW domain-containing adapter protein with coiled-coil [Echinococcus granulosus]